jgi:hypothetical protein
MKLKVCTAILLLGILTACTAAPATLPASVSPEPAAPAEAPLPTEALIPSFTVEQPTVPPTGNSAAQAATVSFVNDVLPILRSRCFNCHGGNETEEGLDISSFASIMAGSDNGPVIVPGDADNSLLAEQVVSQEMPKRGPKLTPPQVQIIIDWINQGALEN